MVDLATWQAGVHPYLQLAGKGMAMLIRGASIDFYYSCTYLARCLVNTDDNLKIREDLFFILDPGANG